MKGYKALPLCIHYKLLAVPSYWKDAREKQAKIGQRLLISQTWKGSMTATNQLRYLTKPPFYPMFHWKSKTQFIFLLYSYFFSLTISIYFLVIEFQMKNQMNHRRFTHNNCNSIKPIGRFKNSSTNHRYCLILSSLSF